MVAAAAREGARGAAALPEVLDEAVARLPLAAEAPAVALERQAALAAQAEPESE